MKKIDKISQLNCQLCFAHGLHLAVCDVLHQNKCVVHTDREDYDYDDNQEEKMFEEGFATLIPTTASNEVPCFNVDIENVLKARKVVKRLRNLSLVKNDVLQKYV